MLLCAVGSQKMSNRFRASVYFLTKSEGGRSKPVTTKYIQQLFSQTWSVACRIDLGKLEYSFRNNYVLWFCASRWEHNYDSAWWTCWSPADSFVEYGNDIRSGLYDKGKWQDSGYWYRYENLGTSTFTQGPGKTSCTVKLLQWVYCTKIVI